MRAESFHKTHSTALKSSTDVWTCGPPQSTCFVEQCIFFYGISLFLRIIILHNYYLCRGINDHNHTNIYQSTKHHIQRQQSDAATAAAAATTLKAESATASAKPTSVSPRRAEQISATTHLLRRRLLRTVSFSSSCHWWSQILVPTPTRPTSLSGPAEHYQSLRRILMDEYESDHQYPNYLEINRGSWWWQWYW